MDNGHFIRANSTEDIKKIAHHVHERGLVSMDVAICEERIQLQRENIVVKRNQTEMVLS
jgi:hypothetical protein